MRISYFAVVALISGCASSGPVPVGRDTYMITKQGAGGAFASASSVKADVIREGYAFCASKGKIFQIVNTAETPFAPGRLASSEVNFMCLSEGDREIGRPKLERSPDAVIEIRK